MRRELICALICALTIMAMPGCGNSSGGNSSGNSEPDTMTLIISSPSGTSTTTYAEGAYSTNSLGNSFLNPSLDAFITVSDETFIELHYWDGFSLGTTRFINMHLIGNSPGIYSLDTNLMNYSSIYGQFNESGASTFSSTNGTITLSSVGNVSEKITGTFDAIVSLVSNTSDSLRITGSFSITRDY